ncbi:YfbM family protein, partial [Streptomyces puniciscabiei]
PDVHDGFGGPPRLLSVAAVSDISRALNRLDLDGVLARLPTTPSAAATACGFPGFSGDVRAYLAGHFAATRAFFREADRQGMCVVVWID